MKGELMYVAQILRKQGGIGKRRIHKADDFLSESPK